MIKNNIISILCAAIFLGLASGAALAEGSAEAGKEKAVSLTCSGCHGPDGNSLVDQWPSLAGQNETYLIASLEAFRSGERENVQMTAPSANLTDQDIADLAAWFSSQKPVGRTADPELVALGERLYRGGDQERQISACIACHGPAGKGNGPAGYPALAGQHAAYTATQLRAYAARTRATDPNQMMRSVAVRLREDDILALASYIQGLR